MPGGVSKVTEKGQVTIPRELRERWGIAPGTQVIFTEADGVITLRPFRELEELLRQAHEETRKQGITRADVSRAVKEARRRTGEEFAKKHGPPRRD